MFVMSTEFNQPHIRIPLVRGIFQSETFFPTANYRVVSVFIPHEIKGISTKA